MAEEREEAEKSRQTYAALGVGFVCIVIGLPLWWKTTDVYRVQLPYSDIRNLAETNVKYMVDVSTIIINQSYSDHKLSFFGEKLKQAFESVESPQKGLSSNYRGNLRVATNEENTGYLQATTLQDLDQFFMRQGSNAVNGKYQVVILPSKGHLGVDKPYIGRGRTVYIPLKDDLESTVPLIVKILRDTLVNEGAINKAFYTAHGVVFNQANKEAMRSLRLYPGYEVTFTLLNPNPEEITANWDIKKAIDDFMSPLLNALSPFTNINVKSQYLHSVPLGVTPVKDESSGNFVLQQHQLPHIINPIEAYLSSHVSVNPNLNFVLYVTPKSQHPLHINDPTGESAGDSFLSPRWGGVMVYNVPLPEGDQPQPISTDIDMRPVMEVFLNQFRLLIGINPQSDSEVEVASPGVKVISDWELDQWLRLRAVENIATSVSTLRSLTDLVEKISNLVINDDIGREVERSVTSLHTALSNLNQAKLTDGFIFSRQALLSSEKAFFDPSLLELLYFPEDQKFAIYIPLFLPISIPVIMSVIQAVKRLRQKAKVKEE